MENTTNTNPQPSNYGQSAPDSNLVWAILATILCCWPFGIPAIVNAAKVDKYWIAGYREQAIDASNKAKKWSIISACVAAGFWLLYIILVVVLGVSLAEWGY